MHAQRFARTLVVVLGALSTALATSTTAAAAGSKPPAALSGAAPGWPSVVARVRPLVTPAVTVAIARSATAAPGGNPLQESLRATVAAACGTTGARDRACPVPRGRLTWRLDGADAPLGNLALATRQLTACTRVVAGLRPSTRCRVTFPTYGDQWVTATYESDPRARLAPRLDASATVAVVLPAPVDLAAGHDFAAYGNTGPGALEDCTFAAAADWVEATYGTIPDPAQVVASYRAAESAVGGGHDVGLTTSQLFSYWQRSGIAGTTLTSAQPVVLSEVGSLLAGHHALLATAELPPGFPGGHSPGGAHAWLVVGDSAYGPMVVTWGQEVQLSWTAFDAWTTGVREIQMTHP